MTTRVPDKRINRFIVCLATALLAACASAPEVPADDCNCGSSAPASAKAAAPAKAAAAQPAAALTAEPQSQDAKPFETRYARFEPMPFADVPGWGDDQLHDGLSAFRQSCTALRKKPVWGELCNKSDAIDAKQPQAWRQFFEENFRAYSVQQLDHTPDGLVTGYYEPLLNGSRNPSPRFAYPIYGTPSDLMYVDAKSLTGAERQWFRNDDRLLIPAVPGAKGAREYLVRLTDTEPGIRDKKFRVRVEDGATAAIVPYWSRQEIEKRELRAPVFAWVDDPYLLYSLQVQGSGKVKLSSGEIVRVAYAEQNGYPFLPRGKPEDAVLVASAAKTRGLQIASASPVTAPTAASSAAAPVQNGEVADIIAKLKGKSTLPAQSPGSAPVASAPKPAKPVAAAPTASSQGNAGMSPEVAAMIAALKKPGSTSLPAAPTASAPSSTSTSASTSSPDPALASLPASAPKVSQVTDIPDPSYVFFRRIADGPQGPLGALGVSLTPGRSIAVDPRTTPLGYPVFLSTVDDDGTQKHGRLMFAQDTGGAIRGAVRADFFWGFGPKAGSQAAAMKESGRMWLLLPKDLQIAAADPVRTRGIGGVAQPLDCVVPDADNCVEE